MTTTAEKNKTTTLLAKALAESYILLLKTHNFHWNVTGSNFYSLHKLFEDQYTELFAAVDELAERIRALGSKAPGSFAEFSKLSNISEATNNLDANAMLTELCKSNNDIVETLIQLRDAADQDEDKETEDIAISRIQTHQKNAWMLDSSRN